MFGQIPGRVSGARGRVPDMRSLIALVALSVPVLASCSTSPEDEHETEGFTAQAMCKEFVKDKLKAPASAEFSDEQHVEEGTGWRVTGVVDSENSFGAMIRGSFTCVLENTGGDMWEASLVEVE